MKSESPQTRTAVPVMAAQQPPDFSNLYGLPMDLQLLERVDYGIKGKRKICSKQIPLSHN